MKTQGTALVTGASSGLGAAYARLLAAAGYDLIICARREDRLQALSDEITAQHTVNVQWLDTDLTVDADVQKVIEAIEQTDDLTLLVNNAGFERLGRFDDVDVAIHAAMIKLHTETPMRLCHAALQGMKTRRQGAIINVSSIGAFLGLPNNLSYSATKAYLLQFSDTLAYEVREYNIVVQALCPGFVRTEIMEAAGIDLEALGALAGNMMEPDAVVRQSLAALQRRQRVLVPGLSNKLMRVLMRLPLTSGAIRHYAKGLQF